MTIINHWGKWVDSDKPVTGVLSTHSVAWEWMFSEICLTCQALESEIESDNSLNDDEKDSELEYIECDPYHTRLYGDWKQDDKGLWVHDEKGTDGFAAIENESTLQVVWSRNTAKGALCSPCYPGQVDLDSSGEFIGYTLPDELLRKDE